MSLKELSDIITSSTASLYIYSPNAQKFLDLLLHHADSLECAWFTQARTM